MADNDDMFGGELFDDFLGSIKPGTTVTISGVLRYRQGADPSDWSAAGGTKYLPRDWQMMCGSAKWTGAAATSGGFEITFPVAFGDSPVVYVSPAGTFPPFEEIRFQATIQSSEVTEIYWWSTNNLTKVYVSWFAIGPVGLK